MSAKAKMPKPKILFVDDEHPRFVTLEKRIGHAFECIYRPGVWSAYEFLMGRAVGDDEYPPAPPCPVDLIMLDFNLFYSFGVSAPTRGHAGRFQPAAYQGEDLRTLEEIREAREKRLISKQVFKRLKKEAEANGGERKVVVPVTRKATNLLPSKYGRDALVVPRQKAIKLVRSNAAGGPLVPVPTDDPRPPANISKELKNDEAASSYFRERLEGRKGKTEFSNEAEFLAAASDPANYDEVIDEVLQSLSEGDTDAAAAAAAELMDSRESRWPLDWDKKDLPGKTLADDDNDYASHFYRGGSGYAYSGSSTAWTPKEPPPFFHKKDEDYRDSKEIAKTIAYNWPKVPVIIHSNCPSGAEDLLEIFDAKVRYIPQRGIVSPQCVAITGAYERAGVDPDGTLFFDAPKPWTSSWTPDDKKTTVSSGKNLK